MFTTKHILTLLIGALAVLAPIQGAVIVCTLLVISDLVTGVLAAKKQGKPITSGGLRQSIMKLYVYETALILAFLTEAMLTGPAFPISKIVSAFIGITEMTSNLENLNILSGQNLLQTILARMNASTDKDKQKLE